MPDPGPPAEHDAEDLKLVTLARSSRARAGAAAGAAVRDETGRTYTAASVTLPSLELSALRAAAVIAAGSGVRAVAAAAVVRSADAGQPLPAADLEALRDLGGAGAVVLLAGADGAVITTTRA